MQGATDATELSPDLVRQPRERTTRSVDSTECRRQLRDRAPSDGALRARRRVGCRGSGRADAVRPQRLRRPRLPFAPGVGSLRGAPARWLQPGRASRGARSGGCRRRGALPHAASHAVGVRNYRCRAARRPCSCLQRLDIRLRRPRPDALPCVAGHPEPRHRSCAGRDRAGRWASFDRWLSHRRVLRGHASANCRRRCSVRVTRRATPSHSTSTYRSARRCPAS